MNDFRIGIDLGGTKIEVLALDRNGCEIRRHRVPTPTGYEATIAAISGLVRDTEAHLGGSAAWASAFPA